MVCCAIALGGNLGDARAALAAALVELDRYGLAVRARSSWYRTTAVGPPQPDYLNGCALVETTVSPEAALASLLAIEDQFGRVRRERWGPRTLDLDLLLYGDRIVDLPHLQIPHPRLHERAFVLVPLAEIAPHWVEPRSRRTIAELLARVDRSGVRLEAAD